MARSLPEMLISAAPAKLAIKIQTAKLVLQIPIPIRSSYTPCRSPPPRIHFQPMPRARLLIRHFLPLLLIVFASSCGQPLLDLETSPDTSFFGATQMRIHPIFSQIKDWNGDGKPDGLE